MSECQQCPKNTISTAGADSCTPCETGQQANSQKTQCGKQTIIEKNIHNNEKLSFKISLNQISIQVSIAQSNLQTLQTPAKVEPTKTVLCQSVNSVQKTLSVKRVLDCACLVLNDLLPMEIKQNAVNYMYIVL